MLVSGDPFDPNPHETVIKWRVHSQTTTTGDIGSSLLLLLLPSTSPLSHSSSSEYPVDPVKAVLARLAPNEEGRVEAELRR